MIVNANDMPMSSKFYLNIERNGWNVFHVVRNKIQDSAPTEVMSENKNFKVIKKTYHSQANIGLRGSVAMIDNVGLK